MVRTTRFRAELLRAVGADGRLRPAVVARLLRRPTLVGAAWRARPSIAPCPREPRAVRARVRGSPGQALRPLAALLVGVLLALPAPAAGQSSYAFFPLPAFDTDPNEGETYGVLPVWMFKDADGRVRTILAPSVTYNEIRGVTGTFRYFVYPTALERLELVASYSEKIDRELDVHYRNLDVFGGRFHADVQLLHERTSSVRFFGIGPESEKEDETNMTLEVTGSLRDLRDQHLEDHATVPRRDTPAIRGLPRRRAGAAVHGRCLSRPSRHRGGDDPRPAGRAHPRQPRLLDHADRGALRQRVRRGLHRAPRKRRRLPEGRRRGDLPQAVLGPPRDPRPPRALRGALR